MPCLEEIPYFQDITGRYKAKNVSLLFVSLDMKQAYPVKVNEMARRLKLVYPVVWLDETNADYFCPKVDSAWSGAIPATLFINNKTGYRKFYEEKIKEDLLEKEIMAILTKKD